MGPPVRTDLTTRVPPRQRGRAVGSDRRALCKLVNLRRPYGPGPPKQQHCSGSVYEVANCSWMNARQARHVPRKGACPPARALPRSSLGVSLLSTKPRGLRNERTPTREGPLKTRIDGFVAPRAAVQLPAAKCVLDGGVRRTESPPRADASNAAGDPQPQPEGRAKLGVDYDGTEAPVGRALKKRSSLR